MLDCKLAVWKWEKVRFTHCYWISYWLTAEGWRCSSDQPGFLEGRRPQWLQTTCLHALSFRFPLLLPILFCLLSPSISTMHPCIPPFIPYALFLPLQSYFSPLFPRTGPPSATPPPQMHPLLGSFPPSISGGGGVLPLQLVGAPTQVWWAPSFQGLHLHTATPGCGVSWLQAALQKRSCLPQSSDNDVQTEIIHLPCGPKEQLMVRSVPCLKEEKNDCNIS